MNTSNLLMHESFARFVSPDRDVIVIEHEEGYEEKKKLEEVRRKAVMEADARWQRQLAAEVEKNRKLWAAMDASFNGFMKDVEGQIARQLIDVSVKLAEIIIRRELPDKSMVKDVIKDVLSPVSDLQGAKVRVCRSDLESLLKAREESGARDITARIELVADDTLMPGDVVIESKNGYFDARISERIKLLQEKLGERLRYSDEYNAKS